MNHTIDISLLIAVIGCLAFRFDAGIAIITAFDFALTDALDRRWGMSVFWIAYLAFVLFYEWWRCLREESAREGAP